MELTRSQQQYILDVLAELRGRQLGIDLKFTLKPEPEETPKAPACEPEQAAACVARQ